MIAGGAVSPNPGPSWKEIGTGDFNDDGHSDILWQNANGQAAIWDMNGTNLIGGGAVSPNPGPSWKAIGTGDFNDDGHSDILWQNANGQAAIWDMNGNASIGGGAVTPNPGPSWKAVGTGDFNDDGHSDILWQNANGQAAVWEMNGNNVIGGGVAGANPGPSWQVIGTGDFNSDGHSDILWQNANGQVAIWEMNGNNVIGGGVVSANPGPSWHAIGTGGEGVFRHPVPEYERPDRDLGHERNQYRQRRSCQPQSRAELEGGRARLTAKPRSIQARLQDRDRNAEPPGFAGPLPLQRRTVQHQRGDLAALERDSVSPAKPHDLRGHFVAVGRRDGLVAAPQLGDRISRVNSRARKGRGRARRAVGRRGLGSLRSPLAAFVVAFALLVQLFAVATPPSLSAPAFAGADEAAVAAELKALFGNNAELCAHINDHGSPGKHGPCGNCCDQCPLCRLIGQAAAFVAPDAPSAPERLDAGRRTIGAAPDFGAFPARAARTNLARAPPLAV